MSEFYKTYIANNFYIKPICAWIVWMTTGTVYYSIANELGWAKGFYMAVNVGYSIGWGYPIEISEGARLFSTVYVLVGASAVAASLGYFGQALLVSSKEWYNEALLEAEDVSSKPLWRRCQVWLEQHDFAVKVLLLWMVWIASMIIFSCNRVGWSFIDGLYFAVSSLSTGGLFAIPNDSPDWYYGLVGCLAATGVPLMGMAMGQLASLLVTVGDPEELKNLVNAKVTAEELEMMKRFNMDDGDGKIDRHEFVLLCVVRMGALSPEFIGTIYKRFEDLDTDGSGSLDYHEILETKKVEPVTKRASTPATTSSSLPPFLQSDLEHGTNESSTNDRKSKRKSNTKPADNPIHGKESEGDNSIKKARGTQLGKLDEKSKSKRGSSGGEDTRSNIL